MLSLLQTSGRLTSNLVDDIESESVVQRMARVFRFVSAAVLLLPAYFKVKEGFIELTSNVRKTYFNIMG